jgi:hypothetical protein
MVIIDSCCAAKAALPERWERSETLPLRLPDPSGGPSATA